MLEVLKPSAKRAVHVCDDLLQALAMIARGLLSDGVLELFQALLAWPFHALLEVVAQKVKAAFLRGVRNARLDGVQYQACTRHPLLDERQCLPRLLLTRAQHDKIVRVAHHVYSSLCH